MTTRRTVLAALTAGWILIGVDSALAGGEDGKPWPQWRGPNQDGVCDATGLPTKWGPEENVIWKTELPSWSGATPVLWGDRIFLTSPSAVDEDELAEFADQQKRQQEEQSNRGGRGGRRGRGGFGGGRHPGGQELLLLCVTREDGDLVWQEPIDSGNKLFRKGNNASPSPVTDGQSVWVVTGTGEVAAFDLEGEPKWRRNLQEEYGEFGLNWGYASSPLLHDGKLIIEVLQGCRTDDPSYVMAVDAATGKNLWKVERPTDAPRESPDAYTTPLLLQHAGQIQYVISGGDYVTGHDTETGEELWRVAGLNPRSASNYRIVASPLAVDGMIYAPTRVQPLTAIALGDDLRPTAEDIAWQWTDRGGPDVPTPTCDGKRFYMVSDSGMATCLDAKTGELVWGPERTVQGTVSSSPLLADGKIYFTNEEGITVVLAAGDEFKMLAANELDGSFTLSSPIASGSRLYVRTGAFLYCIGE